MSNQKWTTINLLLILLNFLIAGYVTVQQKGKLQEKDAFIAEQSSLIREQTERLKKATSAIAWQQGIIDLQKEVIDGKCR